MRFRCCGTTTSREDRIAGVKREKRVEFDGRVRMRNVYDRIG
jgi:hypothetical protein